MSVIIHLRISLKIDACKMAKALKLLNIACGVKLYVGYNESYSLSFEIKLIWISKKSSQCNHVNHVMMLNTSEDDKWISYVIICFVMLLRNVHFDFDWYLCTYWLNWWMDFPYDTTYKISMIVHTMSALFLLNEWTLFVAITPASRIWFDDYTM